MRTSCKGGFNREERERYAYSTQAQVRSGSLEPKIALAWSMVHGFATLMLDNRRLAAGVGGDVRRARDLIGELLMRTRPVFEAEDRPAAPARKRRPRP